MLYYIWAAEDSYNGLHGIETYGVYECSDLEEANNTGLELSYQIIENFSSHLYYYNDEDEELGQHTVWEVRKIKDEYSNMTAAELDVICCPDPDGFIEEYTEEVDF